LLNKLFLNNNWFDLDLTSIFKLKDFYIESIGTKDIRTIVDK